MGYSCLSFWNLADVISLKTKHLIPWSAFIPHWGKLININSVKNTLYEASQVPIVWWTGYRDSKCLRCRIYPFFNFFAELFLFSLVLISEERFSGILNTIRVNLFLKIFFGLVPDPPRGVLSWVVAFIVIDILVSFLKIPFFWHCPIQS